MYDIGFFKDEIHLIEDFSLRSIIRDILHGAPKWFWSATASISGKYHPIDDNQEGGNCHHTAKVVWLGWQFARSFDWNKDEFVIAGLLHDIAKYGLKDQIDVNQYSEHAEAAYTHLLEQAKDFFLSDTNRTSWNTICYMVRSHMGKWGSVKPDSEKQKAFHLADMAVSNKGLVGVQFYDRHVKQTIIDVTEGHRNIVMEDGEYYMRFGKKYHEGTLLKTVMKKDMSYINFVYNKDFMTDNDRRAIDETKEAIRKEIKMAAGMLPL